MSHERSGLLSLHEVRFGYPAGPEFLGPVSVTVEEESCWAIVGPNGAGKSTLLRLMAGLLAPQHGKVHWRERPLFETTLRSRAREIAFVPQRPPSDLDLSALEVVLLGRFPHRSFGMFESAEDVRIANEAMSATGTLALADRRIGSLSGGEAQRVHLAAALAQQPRLLLLDEPTASLDLRHQLEAFEMLRARSLREGMAVVAVTHDVNLALRFCGRAIVLHDGRAMAAGDAAQVLTAATLESVYDLKLMELRGSDGDGKWILPSSGARS